MVVSSVLNGRCYVLSVEGAKYLIALDFSPPTGMTTIAGAIARDLAVVRLPR